MAGRELAGDSYVRLSTSDRVDLDHQVQMFTDVIKAMKARQMKPGHCQRVADYERIVAEIKEALAAMASPSRLH